MAKKPLKRVEYREVIYTAAHWTLLEQLRKKTMRTMQILESSRVDSIVHGSIARGDVSEKSDIDIFIPSPPSSFIVETALEKADMSVNKRLVVQSTPPYAMKAHIEIDETTSIIFPLMKMRRVEREFYTFSGEADLDTLNRRIRVAGVDKRLMLIEPTDRGHKESTVAGKEEHVARLLGIAVETVLDRVHTLIRRDDIGRTGVFIKQELRADETFEMALARLAKQNPAVRRRLKGLS